MKESLTAFVFVLAGFVAGHAVSSKASENHLIRDCSLTGTYVINNDTVVVCQVLSRTTTSTPQPQSKKPEISL